MSSSLRNALPVPLLAALTQACFSEPGYEGRLCAEAAPCPAGYTCDPTGHCAVAATAVDAGTARDAAEAAPDAAEQERDAGSGDAGTEDGGFSDAGEADAALLDAGSDAGVETGPGFRRVGDLQVGRVWHAAARLADGRVLVTGGFPIYGQFDNVTATAEIFDPATETWSPAGSMPIGRAAHELAVLPDGRVVAVGGTDNYGVSYVGDVHVLDPSTGGWQAAGALQEGRNNVGVAVLSDGRVLVAGGYPGGTLADLFDPVTNMVAPVSALAVWRHSHRAFTLPDGRGLAIGGASNGFTPTTELYDPATGTWSSGPSMQTGRARFTLSELQDGRLMVAGGHDTDNALVFDSVELYNPATGTWSPGSPMNHARARHAACALDDGRVLVTGGDDNGIVATAEIYDPESDTWTDLPGELGSFYHTVTALPGGRALVVGGLGADQRESWIFEP